MVESMRSMWSMQSTVSGLCTAVMKLGMLLLTFGVFQQRHDIIPAELPASEVLIPVRDRRSSARIGDPRGAEL